jgi:SAM-dependent methyltransferase
MSILSRAEPRLEPAFPSPEARARRVRERAAPRPGDPFYVHLRDLRDALAAELAGGRGRWLDYGSDTSPYRHLLGRAEVRTADMLRGGTRPDHVLDEEGAIPGVAAATFDGVLSTQVLEHVPDAGAYLREALRVLKPGGRLVLTTHGVWEDHPGPLDLRRWTLDGLARDAAEAGFRVVRRRGLTCRRRAALFLLQQQFAEAARFAPARRVLDALSDRLLAADRCRVDDARLYLAILHVAERPGDL